MKMENIEKKLEKYSIYLKQEEKSANTIRRYLSDARRFLLYIGRNRITKTLVLEYKENLIKIYQISSVNSILAAINSFLRFCGLERYRIRNVRAQKKLFCEEERELYREEYIRLIKVAEQEKNEKIAMIMRTIGCTGMRISELRYLTAESLKKGEVKIMCKGKYRMILMPGRLREKLLEYIQKKNITKGSIFVTRNGKELDRTSIWRQMQRVARKAGVCPSKVFPHNFRHMFARTYYEQEKDIARLADILGHTSINTTRLYVISSGAEHRRQLDELGLVV